MNNNLEHKRNKNDKIIPFTLVKYFTLTSFLLMFLGTISLSTFHTHLVRNIILEKSKDYTKALVENLNHQIMVLFILPIYIDGGIVQLIKKKQYERMDKIVRSTLHSFETEILNIYDLNNVVSYSFNQEMIGKEVSVGQGYKKALKGQMISNMVQEGSFLRQLIRYPEHAKITTFAPLRIEIPASRLKGPIIGVIEIEQDVSEDYHKIFKLQILVILTTTMVMVILFFILRQIVKKGESIIIEKNIERFRLKEELDRARHLSSIGEMTAIISHEIKNPLGIIRSTAEHLNKKFTTKNQPSKFTEIIIEESTRMNNIINDFLSFSKPPELSLKPSDINSILLKNINYLKYELDKNNCVIHTFFDSKIPDILIDENQIYQTFLNIIINSMQAMPEGGEITIKTRLDKKDVIIEFEDTGSGIPEDIIYKVKDPFFTTKNEGSGLGLGIVEKTVKDHKGSVYIDNTIENGARISIIIPVNAGEK
ncbi:MAG: two-component sensor histidine kinase [Deltaproteobacteria bacterium]|nr:MAG: two-component sensor histidine kinase [Deltaproteobacteria bacterium]